MILQRVYLDQWRFTPVDIYGENKSARTSLLFVGINVSADSVPRAASRRELGYRASLS